MAGYAIRVRASVEKDITALPRPLTMRILQSIDRPLRDAPAIWRAQIERDRVSLPAPCGGLSDHICCASRGAGSHHPLCPPPSQCIPRVVTSNCLLAGKAQGYSCLFPGFAGLLNPRRGLSPFPSCHILMNRQSALLRPASGRLASRCRRPLPPGWL